MDLCGGPSPARLPDKVSKNSAHPEAGSRDLSCLLANAIYRCNPWGDLATSDGTGALTASTISARVALPSMGHEVPKYPN